MAARQPKLPDGPPKVLLGKIPRFPEELIGVVSEGSVRLEFTIGRAGKAHTIKVLESTHELFESLATHTIDTATFSPAIKDGKPFAARIRQTVLFEAPQLKGE